MKNLLSLFSALIVFHFSHAQTPPVALNDTFLVAKNADKILSVTQNDTNYAGGALTLSILTPAAYGTASIFNSIQINYKPSKDYLGLDAFVYSICDTNQLCDTASVSIIVVGSNSPPTAFDDELVITEGEDSVALNVLGNDYDPESDSLHVRLIIDEDTIHPLGQVSFDSETGTIYFVRNPGICGSQKFEYMVCDASGCDTGEATIYIYCPGNIFAPEGFSPNGDGKNDLLVFKDLEFFAPASLRIFNRYGSTVYESEDYKNDWDGTTMSTGRTLPDGTYFYVLQLIDKRRFSNYLIINR